MVAFAVVCMLLLLRPDQVPRALCRCLYPLTCPSHDCLQCLWARYCVTTAMLHYAKGVAYAATGDVPSALVQRGLFGQCAVIVRMFAWRLVHFSLLQCPGGIGTACL